MINGRLLTATVLALLAVGCSGLGLTIGDIKCGQLICKNHEYCSEIDNRCSSCVTICDTKNHNFDSAICYQNCQNYLHDLNYIRNDNSGSTGKSQASNSNTTLMIVLLILVIFIYLIAFVLFIIYYKELKNKFVKAWTSLKRKCTISKKSSQNQIPSVLRPGPVTSSNAVAPQTLNAHDLTSMQRQAAEDSPVDHSYDNMASDTTPPPNSHPRRPRDNFV